MRWRRPVDPTKLACGRALFDVQLFRHVEPVSNFSSTGTYNSRCLGQKCDMRRRHRNPLPLTQSLVPLFILSLRLPMSSHYRTGAFEYNNIAGLRHPWARIFRRFGLSECDASHLFRRTVLQHADTRNMLAFQVRLYKTRTDNLIVYAYCQHSVSYTHLTLPTIYSV